MMFYSLGESVSNAISLIYTKFFWRKARLVRLPVFARNKKNIIVGADFTCGKYCRITAGESIERRIIIGNNFVMGDMCQLEGIGGLNIGDNVLLASKVFISTASHGSYLPDNSSSPLIPPNKRDIILESVTIGDNVWIGNNVCVLAGVKIGNGCIVGANSVVTKDVEENTIVVGSPARAIKKYNFVEEKWEKI